MLYPKEKNESWREQERRCPAPKTDRISNKRYPRIYTTAISDSERGSDTGAPGSDQELNFLGLVERNTLPASAPLRIMVHIHRHPEMRPCLCVASKRITDGATLKAIVKLDRPCTTDSPTVLDTMRGSIASNRTAGHNFFESQARYNDHTPVWGYKNQQRRLNFWKRHHERARPHFELRGRGGAMRRPFNAIEYGEE